MKKITRKLAAMMALLSAVSLKAFAAPANTNPLTGDDFNMTLCITVMAICVVGLAAILVVLLISQSKLKKRRKQAQLRESEEAEAPAEEPAETDPE